MGGDVLGHRADQRALRLGIDLGIDGVPVLGPPHVAEALVVNPPATVVELGVQAHPQRPPAEEHQHRRAPARERQGQRGQQQQERRGQQHPPVHEVAADADHEQRRERTRGERRDEHDEVAPDHAAPRERTGEDREQDDARDPQRVGRDVVDQVLGAAIPVRRGRRLRERGQRDEEAVVAGAEDLVADRQRRGGPGERGRPPPRRPHDSHAAASHTADTSARSGRTSGPSPHATASQS